MHQDQKAQAIVEFALVVPFIMLLLLFGLVVGHLAFQQVMLESAGDDLIRELSLQNHETGDQLKIRAREWLKNRFRRPPQFELQMQSISTPLPSSPIRQSKKVEILKFTLSSEFSCGFGLSPIFLNRSPRLQVFRHVVRVKGAEG
jgi:hypothetical protein